MKEICRPNNHHWLVLLVIMAGCAAIGAMLSVDLIGVTMANAEFIANHGWLAIQVGGLRQFLGILIKATIVFTSYLVFKAIEAELVSRWRS